MAMKGMDVEGGRQAAQQVNQCASEMEALNARCTQVIEGFEWHGPDAERTRAAWQSEYRAQLQTITTALQEFAALVNQQAQQQEEVSAA
jgi:hypothetical protein